jgi:hypothetical protein
MRENENSALNIRLSARRALWVIVGRVNIALGLDGLGELKALLQRR